MNEECHPKLATMIYGRPCRFAQLYTFAGFPQSRPRWGRNFPWLLAGVSLPLLVFATGPAASQEIIGHGTTVTVPGNQPTPWILSDGLLLGYAGSGELQITMGGRVESTGTYIGFQGEGTVAVSGGEFLNSGTLGVGYGSKGTLTIDSRGLAEISDAVIGLFGDGTVSVTGDGSSWINHGELQVGYQANAELTIDAGGRVDNTIGIVGGGDRPGVAGTVLVTGGSSIWAISDAKASAI